MKWLLLLILLQLATATATWQPSGLRVEWSAPEPVCLVLVGGGLRDALFADVPCAASGAVTLARGGDYLLSPVNRDRVSLRAQADLTREVAGADVPPQCARCVVILPLVVKV